jgi:hypothetical protein
MQQQHFTLMPLNKNDVVCLTYVKSGIAAALIAASSPTTLTPTKGKK